jgi:hypothetical protein
MKFTKILLVIMLLVVSLVLISCDSGSEESLPNDVSVGSPAPAESTPIVEKEELPYNIWVQELKLKGQAVVEYEYNYQSDYLNHNGLIIQKSSYQAEIKGEKIRKTYSKPLKLKEGIFYDTVYLNAADKTATGICLKRSITCEDMKEKYVVLSYEDEKLDPTPVDLIKGVDKYSKSTSQRSYENRKVTYVESQLPDFKTERLYVDEFSGLPLRREVFNLKDGKEIILEQQDFSQMSTGSGSVDIENVVLPSGLTLVS